MPGGLRATDAGWEGHAGRGPGFCQEASPPAVGQLGKGVGEGGGGGE